MLAHEALHCALSHFARRGHRLKHKWDLACDFAINPLLVEEGLKPPPNAVIMDEYKGLTAEEIYPLIEDNDETETLDQHLYDSTSEGGGTGGSAQAPPEPESDGAGDGERSEQDDSAGGGRGAKQDDRGTGEAERETEHAEAGQPTPLTPDERETLNIQWQQRMAGAAQQAMQAGKFGGTLARLIDHLLQPQIPWRMLLARFLTSLARDDFSYMRPSRREGDAIFPSLRSAQVDLAVAVDTSGSIRSEEVSEFLSEINAIKGQIRARITFLPCDASLAEDAPWVFEPWEAFDMPDRVHGGGGTEPIGAWGLPDLGPKGATERLG
jgi:predicted metal-dependent peptidase